MLHSMKKSMAKATASKRGVDMPAEYQEMKTQIELTKKNVKLADTAMTSANKAWLDMMINQRNFSQSFSEGYPKSSDEMAAAAAEFSSASEEIYNHFVRETSEEGSQLKALQEKLRHYLGEIDDVENLYGKLVEAKTESARYQNKVDSLAKKKKENDVKKSRNFEKLDAQRGSLDELVSEVTTAQKKLIAKSALVHKVAMVAYWHANEMHLKIAQRSMEQTAEFAGKHMTDLLALDMETLEVSDDDALAGLMSIPSVNPENPSAVPEPVEAAPAVEEEPRKEEVKPTPA